MKTAYKCILLVLWLNAISYSSISQTFNTDSSTSNNDVKFKHKYLIIPSVLILYGFVGLEYDELKFFNEEIREEVAEHIDEKFTIDDIAQYTPTLAVYGLNALGVKGKNNFGKRTVIIATAYLLMSSTTLALKSLTKVQRPDGTSKNSFPSGHTATAFMGAEFLWQEYKDQSIWYGITGYFVAGATGAFRMYNNRHWLTDVATGAGIGILSTKAAYWVNPFIQNKIFKQQKNSLSSYMLMPFNNGKQTGLSVSIIL